MRGGIALVEVSLRQLAAHSGRTVLTALALLLGILSVTCIQLADSVVEQTLVRQLETERGRNDAVVAMLPASERSRVLAVELVKNDLRLDASVVVDEAANGRSSSGAVLRVRGYAGTLLGSYPFRVIEGSSTGVMVNEAARGIAPWGGTVKLTGSDQAVSETHVRGLIDDGSSEPTVYVPLALLPTIPSSARLQVVLNPDLQRSDRRATLVDALVRADLNADSVEIVDVKTPLQETLRTTRLGFTVVGLVTLLIGSLGVLNIGLATLRTRVEELALRRSLGATKADVGWIVLLDAVLLGALSSLVAVGLAVLGYRLLLAELGAQGSVTFPISAVGIGTAAGVLASTCGGLAPALAAARAPIAAVMRA